MNVDIIRKPCANRSFCDDKSMLIASIVAWHYYDPVMYDRSIHWHIFKTGRGKYVNDDGRR